MFVFLFFFPPVIHSFIPHILFDGLLNDHRILHREIFSYQTVYTKYINNDTDTAYVTVKSKYTPSLCKL